MALEQKLDELVAYVEGAKAMPFSASCVVNRGELLQLLDELRAQLPEAVAEARGVVRDRDAVIDEGRAEAARIVAAARAERARMLSKSEVHQEATREAERVVSEARAEAEAMRDEVDAYVDTKLANFEVALERTLTAVSKGRDKLRGRHPADELGPLAEDGDDLLEGVRQP